MLKKYLSILILISCAVPGSAQSCSKSGDAKTPEKRKLNVFKNAGVTVNSSRIPEDLPLNKLITKKKRKDRQLFMDGAYVVTEGYLISFEEEGGESCNCQKAKISLKNGDVHMYVGLKKDALKKDCIVVEITPDFKKKHPEYATLLEENSKIRITGFLLYDFIHEKDAINTCNSCSLAWRKTCWEIHPVTDIEIL
ncbi:MAG TPA: hypothetical protein VHL77_07550 [Ferruginibacter sp.]|nr:hypothetical protein [Ferruginibacter sp.]